MLTFPSAHHHVQHPPQGLGELRKSTFFFGGKNTTHSLFSNPQNPLHTVPVHDVIHHLVPIHIWDFYFDISEWHILPERAWTPALMLHLTNPRAKRKVLSLTKPKGKIYKTKSLGHYITPFLVWSKWTEQSFYESSMQRIFHYSFRYDNFRLCFWPMFNVRLHLKSCDFILENLY